MIKFLDLHKQYLSIKTEIDSAIEQVIGWSAYIGGDYVRQFEAQFAAFQEAGYCVGVGNGTDAIEIALESLNLPKGSEVIVPANSFIASSEAVTRSGLKVVFCDVRPGDYCIDINDVRRRVSPRTSALLAVHLYGHPCDMSAILDVARECKLKVVEDCAQAHGAEFERRRVGALGDIGAFSFYPGKNLGAYGDAGAIVTNDEALARRVRMIANHGRLSKYDHEFEGRNSRLDGLQAAILSAKLPHLDGWLDHRIKIARIYHDGLQGIPDLGLPDQDVRVRAVYHLFVVRTALRDQLQSHLAAAGIETGVHYPIALPRLRAYEYLHQGDQPMFANSVGGQLLSLPIGEHLSLEDAEYVVSTVRAYFGK
jgi:dTDP-4-amino-4,6-dideoxygalactose transaminase